MCSNSVDKKNAKVALDAYVGVLQSVFDHQAPVRKEAEFFLQHMDDWTGRDPLAELPKANFAARVSVQREKGVAAITGDLHVVLPERFVATGD